MCRAIRRQDRRYGLVLRLELRSMNWSTSSVLGVALGSALLGAGTTYLALMAKRADDGPAHAQVHQSSSIPVQSGEENAVGQRRSGQPDGSEAPGRRFGPFPARLGRAERSEPEDREGWPEDSPPALRADRFEREFRRVLKELEVDIESEVDCSEYPCIAMLPYDANQEIVQRVMQALEKGALAPGLVVRSNLHAETSARGVPGVWAAYWAFANEDEAASYADTIGERVDRNRRLWSRELAELDPPPPG